MKRLNKTKSAVFLYCRLSLILKDPFPDLLAINVLADSSFWFDTPNFGCSIV